MGGTHGKVWWSELMTHDPDAARDFFTAICGWTFEEAQGENAPFYIAHSEHQPVAGIMDMRGNLEWADLPAHWMTYLAVEDVDKAAEQTAGLGGQVHRKPFDVPGVGRIAIVSDPSGGVVGLMSPQPMGG